MKRTRILSTLLLTLAMLITYVPSPITASLGEASPPAPQTLRPMDYLDRGLVAVKVTSGVFLSWRFLGNEPDDVAYNVYRDDANIATVTGKSNYTDPDGLATSSYQLDFLTLPELYGLADTHCDDFA